MGCCKQPTQWEEEKNNVSCDLLPGLRAHAPPWGQHKPPCCGTSLAVLLARNGANSIHTSMPLPASPPLGRSWGWASRSAWELQEKGITYSSLAISSGQSVKWAWRLSLLSRCSSSISPPFTLPPKLQAEPVGIDSECLIPAKSSKPVQQPVEFSTLFFFSQWRCLGSAWRPGHTSELCWRCSHDLATHHKWEFFKLVIKRFEK